MMNFDLQRFATQKNQSVHSGNTILLKAKGVVIGRAQSLDGRRSFGTEGVYEIGSIMPQEHINNRYEGTITLERFLIKKSDLAKAGLAALGEEVLTHDVIDIEVLSKYGTEDNVVRVYRGCTVVDYSENFRVGAISGENATFQYLSCDRGNQDTEALRELYEGMNEFGQGYFTRTNYTAVADPQAPATPDSYMYDSVSSGDAYNSRYAWPTTPPSFLNVSSGNSTTSGG